MRFPFITALIAGAALAQVGANPIRLLIISSPEADIESTNNRDVRFGHAVPHINNHGPIATLANPAGSGGKGRRPCNARLRQKSLELSNLFRKLFGLPLTHAMNTAKPSPPADHEYRILPFVGTPPAIVEAKVDEPHHEQGEGEHPHRHHRHHHKHHRGGHKGKKPFTKRLHSALTALGPWEGRAVAFVLGCGIGVLLRMLWVLALVSYRLIKGHKEEENKYTEVIVVEPYEDRGEAVVFPPTYTYPDEKADNKAVTTDAPGEAK